jgi:hypothetical protein
MQWFRHYSGLARDEKLVAVAVKSKQPIERVVWVWCAILESASAVEDGGRYEFDTAEAAYFLRASEDDISFILHGLTDAERVAEGRVVKWGYRQYHSDRSRERQAAYRERRRVQKSGCDVQTEVSDVTLPSRDAVVTAQDTDTDTEIERKKLKLLPKEKRGTRIPEDFEPDSSCHALAEKLLFDIPESQTEFDKFMDYWRSKPGKDGTKLDWQATFKNWLRNAAERKPRNGKSPKPDSRAEGFAKVRAVIEEQHRREQAARGEERQTDAIGIPGPWQDAH